MIQHKGHLLEPTGQIGSRVSAAYVLGSLPTMSDGIPILHNVLNQPTKARGRQERPNL